jgi:hypothetical protein
LIEHGLNDGFGVTVPDAFNTRLDFLAGDSGALEENNKIADVCQPLPAESQIFDS